MIKKIIKLFIIFITCIILLPRIYADSITSLEINVPTDKIPLDVGGYELKLSLNIAPSNTNETIIWSSNNSDIITVTNEGIIKPISLGQTIIKACNENATICDEVEVEVVPNTSIYPIMNSKFLYLYNDGLLYARIGGAYLKLIDSNVLEFENTKYMTYDHKLYNISYTYDGDYIENFSTRLITDDAKKTYAYYYINVNDELYKLNYSSVGDKIYDNVSAYYEKMILTTNDELYVYGNNIYGQKINNGEYINEPILLASNVMEIGDHYYITNDHELYIFNEHILRPHLLDSDVTSVEYIRFDSSYWNTTIVYKKGSSYNYGVAIVSSNQIIPTNGLYQANNYKFVSYYGTREVFSTIDSNNQFCAFGECFNNVKYAADLKSPYYIYLITNDNKLYYWDYQNRNNGFTYLADHVSGFINNDLILMEDGSIWDNINYAKIPSKLYRQKNAYIKANSIIFDTSNLTDITVDDTLDLLTTIIPANITNKTLNWAVDNEELADIDNTGLLTAKKSGVVTVTASSTDGIINTFKVTIHPKPNKVVIENKDQEYILLVTDHAQTNPNYITLNAHVEPDDAIKRRVVWSSSDPNIAMAISMHEDGDGYSSPARIYEQGVMTKKEVTIYAKTEDGVYVDSIKIKLARYYQTIEFHDIYLNAYYGDTYLLKPDSVTPEDFDTSYITYESLSENLYIDENNYFHLLNTEPNYYTINVYIFGNLYREIHVNVENYKAENSTLLREISINNEEYQSFESYIMEYDLGTTTDESITLNAVPYDSNSHVYGNTTYDLAYGTNTLFLSVYNDNISSPSIYTLKIKRLPEYPKGDLNKNNKIDLEDIILLLKLYLGSLELDELNCMLGDMDDNGSIGLNDIIALLKQYLNS